MTKKSNKPIAYYWAVGLFVISYRHEMCGNNQSNGFTAAIYLHLLRYGNKFYIGICKGQRAFLYKLAKIADYLGCTVDYLLGCTDAVEINKSK